MESPSQVKLLKLIAISLIFCLGAIGFGGYHLVKYKKELREIKQGLRKGDFAQLRRYPEITNNNQRLVSLLFAQYLQNAVLNPRDRVKTAQELCNFLASYPSDGDYTGVGVFNAYSVLRDTVTRGVKGYVCGGSAALLIHMLESVGIPARFVGMWNLVEVAGGDGRILEVRDGHSTVEFYTGERWLAIDPLLNIMWQRDDTGEFISYTELREIKNTVAFRPVFLGSPEGYKGVKIPDPVGYHKKYSDYMIVSEAFGIYLGTERFPLEVLPRGWDGIVYASDGTRHDLIRQMAKPHDAFHN